MSSRTLRTSRPALDQRSLPEGRPVVTSGHRDVRDAVAPVRTSLFWLESRGWRPLRSSPRARTGRPTTASASATCFAAAGTASSSSSRSRSPGRSRRRASRSGSCGSRRRRSKKRSPGQFWKDFIRDTAPVFRQPTIEQLAGFIAPTFQALVDGAKYVDDRLHEIIGELEPDVIVEDNVVGFAALPACGRPWARIVSCNPTEVRDPDVPPRVLRLSRLPIARSGARTGTPTATRTPSCTPTSPRSAGSAARRRFRSSSSCSRARG